jgi:tRNA(Ile)-lysidine synthase
LRSACKARQINDLLLGHHRDDQAETILMRLSKGSGIEGLAGMAVESWRGDMRLLRPFLHLDKSRLIATCHAAGLVFIDDPSNQSEKFARGRLRKIMPLLAAEGLTVESLMGLGARAAEANDALEAMTDTVMGRAVCFHTGGDIVVDRAEMLAAPRAIALRVLARCLRQINGGDYPPERAGLLALLDALNGRDGQIGSLAVQKKNSQEELVGLPNNPKLTRTFYGCLIVGRAKDIHILREAAAATEETAFVTDTLLRWDGRWEIFGRVAGLTSENLTLRALGHPPHDILDQLAPRLRRQIPQGRVRASLPALWNGNQLCAVPSFDTSAGLWMRRVKKSYTVFI